jgi:hypothetical protein
MTLAFPHMARCSVATSASRHVERQPAITSLDTPSAQLFLCLQYHAAARTHIRALRKVEAHEQLHIDSAMIRDLLQSPSSSSFYLTERLRYRFFSR